MYKNIILIIFISEKYYHVLKSLCKEITGQKDNMSIAVIDFSSDDSHILRNQFKTMYFHAPGEQDKIDALNTLLSGKDIADDDLLLMSAEVLQSTHDVKMIISEMHEVLYVTEKHGFVSPRFVKPESLSSFCGKTALLPQYATLAEPDLRAVFIKRKMLNLLNTLDKKYDTLYYALHDFVQRANGFGFSTAISNRALVADVESRLGSFITDIDTSDKALFNNRYPYYETVKKHHILHEENPIEKFFTLYESPNEKKRILFNYRDLACTHTGTTKLQIAVLDCFMKLFQSKYDIFVYTDRKFARYHKLSEKYNNILYSDTIFGVFDLGFCASQLYYYDDHIIMNEHCLKNVYILLDIIAIRCNYIRGNFLSVNNSIWLALKLCDGIISISDSTTNDFKSYFNEIEQIHKMPIRRIYLSSDPIVDIREDNFNLPYDDYYLVIGNPYKHKGLEDTIKTLSNTDNNFIVVGYEKSGEIASNIYNYQSGHLEDEFLDLLYSNCIALIFPSIYEGFGLPVVDALYQNKHVILYDNMINKELMERFADYRAYFHFFDTFSQIKEIISKDDFSTVAKKCGNDTSVRYLNEDTCNYTWDDVAVQIESFFDDILQKEPDFDKLFERKRLFGLLKAKKDAEAVQPVSPSFSYRALRMLYRAIKWLLPQRIKRQIAKIAESLRHPT